MKKQLNFFEKVPIYTYMKAFKVLSLFWVPCTVGISFGHCPEMLKNNDIQAREQSALEVIRTSTSMDFLLRAQKELEVRKYDLYNASRDQIPFMSVCNEKECVSKQCLLPSKHHSHKKIKLQH